MTDTVEDFDNFKDLTGRVIADRYTLTRFIQAGGFGAVYEASDIRLPAKKLAVKLCLQIISENSFLREAQLLGQLNHDNIVRVSDQGVHKGIPYIVMDLLVGETAGELMRRHHGRMPQGLILQFVRDVGRALAHAHEHRLVHRDLKPSNVMLVTTGPKTESMRDSKFVLYDFGIASKTDAKNSLANKTFAGAGTPEYMAPEQVKSHEPTDRTDIYSFGVVLFEMLTGQVPFSLTGDSQLSIARVMNDIVETPAPRPSQLAPDVQIPEQIEDLVMQCLEKNPADRPQSISEVYEQFLAAYELRPDSSAFGQTLLPQTGSASDTAIPSSTRRTATTTLQVNHVIPLVLVLAMIFSVAGAATAIFLYVKYFSGGQAKLLRLALSEEQLEIAAGESGKLSLMLNRSSVDQKVVLSVSGEPAGVSLDFPKTASADLVNVVLTVQGDVPEGTSTIAFHGADQNGDPKLTADALFQLQIVRRQNHSDPQQGFVVLPPQTPLPPTGRQMTGQRPVESGSPPETPVHPPRRPREPVDPEFARTVFMTAIRWGGEASRLTALKFAEFHKRWPVPEVLSLNIKSETSGAVATFFLAPQVEGDVPKLARPSQHLPASVRLTPGDYIVRFEAKYYEPQEQQVRLRTSDDHPEILAVDLIPRILQLPLRLAGTLPLENCTLHAPGLNSDQCHLQRLDSGAWQIDCYELLLEDHADELVKLRGSAKNCFPIDRQFVLRELLKSGEIPFGELKPVTGQKAGDFWRLDPDALNLSFAWCPRGEFIRDTSSIQIGPDKKGERTTIAVDEGFWIGRHETTQGQWKFLTDSPEIPQIREARPNPFMTIKVAPLELDDALPVANFNWEDCVNYCERLTSHSHDQGWIPLDWEIRLPFENEWEYACRSGTTTDYAFGETLSPAAANTGGPQAKLMAGGSFPANDWGIFDMHGNVEEWCQDTHTGMAKVRGGHWRSNNIESARSSATGYLPADLGQAMTGFRVVLAPIRKQVPAAISQ